MATILFICTGNTCRSPMAEGFFRCQGGEERDACIRVCSHSRKGTGR